MAITVVGSTMSLLLAVGMSVNGVTVPLAQVCAAAGGLRERRAFHPGKGFIARIICYQGVVTSFVPAAAPIVAVSFELFGALAEGFLATGHTEALSSVCSRVCCRPLASNAVMRC